VGNFLSPPVCLEAQCFLPVRPSVRSSVTKFCEHDILKTNEPILLEISTIGLQGNGMKRSTLGSKGQSSRSHDAEVRFGDLVEASVLTPFGQVGF